MYHKVDCGLREAQRTRINTSSFFTRARHQPSPIRTRGRGRVVDAERGGRNHKFGLWIDICTQRVWVTKLKSVATGKTSRKSYDDTRDLFTKRNTISQGRHSRYTQRTHCGSMASSKAPMQYSYCLKRMCAPDLGEDEHTKMDLPANWPDYPEFAIRYINDRILPNLRYSRNELLLSLIINRKQTSPAEISAEVTPEDASIHTERESG